MKKERNREMIKEDLLKNINKIHTTNLGFVRLNNNLKITNKNIIDYCKEKILDNKSHIYKKGKNWYCEIDNIKITINASSYTIITAKKL